MLIGHSRDLRQMRDTDDLLGHRELTELFTDTLSGHAGNTGIHLVKDHGGHVIAFSEHVFERQHDARELTAGSNLTDAPKRLTGICRDQKTHIVRACTLESGRAAERCDLHVKAHGRHGQLAQFTLDLPLERGGGSPARLRQFRRRCARLLRLLLDHRFELLQPVACVFDLVEPGPGRFKRVDQPRLIRIVFPLQTPEQRQARFDAVKFLVGKIQPVAEVAQRLRRVLQREDRALDGLRQRRELARVVGGPLDLRQGFSGQRSGGIVPAGQQVIRLIDRFRELFKVAQQVAALRELRLFPGLELRALQLFDLAAEAFGQQFFFIFISRERVTLLAQRLIGLVLLAIARELRL